MKFWPRWVSTSSWSECVPPITRRAVVRGFRLEFTSACSLSLFEGLDGQRGIAWRCADSLALRSFLGIAITEDTPVHASMTIIRQRLPESVFDKVFVFVLSLLEDKGLLRGKAVAIDATTLEANAPMKSIVRKDSGEDWK